MTDTANFLSEVDSFLKQHDMAPSRFGRDFLNNPSFLDDVRSKKVSPLLKTVEKLRKRMKAHTHKQQQTVAENGSR